jgi:hypothetical protein
VKLRAIDGGEQREPWHQQPDEDETSFALFAGWLQSVRPRRTPEYPQIALQYHWAERANAYDSRTSLPVTPKGQLERMLADAMTIGALEMRKVMKRVQGSADEELQFRELITLMHALVENKPALEKALADDTATDFSNLSDDEMRAVLAAKRALAKVGK